MLSDPEDLELRPLLRRLFYRGLLALGFFMMVAMLLSMGIRNHLQRQFAKHLSQTVRNDLLIGNNATVLKILKQNIGENFSEISFRSGTRTLFVLGAETGNEPPALSASIEIPICLRADQQNCFAFLVYRYSLLHYFPYVFLVGLVALLIFFLVFWVFRQHVATYYREQLKHHKEAALGRLSARICHDLKLPAMIFQRVAYVEDPAQFLELRPQLQSHLQRLYAMIEKLKKAELEGLIRMESHTLTAEDLQNFLASIAPTPTQLQLDMPPSLQLYLDLDKFERSLANLVLNAFQAGANEVKVRLQDQGQDLIVDVGNDGPEMPAEQVQVFRRHESQPQHGLGLSIVRDTVRAHGGRVDVSSSAEGTRFMLIFPNAVIAAQKSETRPGPVAPIVRLNQSHSPLIWLDDELKAVAAQHVSQAELDPFELSADPEALPQAELIISRNEQVIDRAIQLALPIIMAQAPDDGAWIQAFQSRLRLLKRRQAMSIPLNGYVPVSGQNS
ncbi:sensor histidine kinase [Oligoflexus tunisiensis]|uniref:sensor histidine kinase n=1 Tax=Oligoflexus tunisiensis TaxID=708132 RepID=UPI00114D2988|nr:HAMP domain-containing sensor histidine kinase [Oligoflexus tunisiensis]